MTAIVLLHLRNEPYKEKGLIRAKKSMRLETCIYIVY